MNFHQTINHALSRHRVSPGDVFRGLVDCLSVPLHSPNSRQFACRRQGCTRDMEWGIPIGHKGPQRIAAYPGYAGHVDIA